MMIFLVRVLVFFALLAIAVRWIFGGRKKKAPKREAIAELRRDPVCGTYVSQSEALSRKIKGEAYFFCSESCRDRFDHPGE